MGVDNLLYTNYHFTSGVYASVYQRKVRTKAIIKNDLNNWAVGSMNQNNTR